jgi:hypothetical protein
MEVEQENPKSSGITAETLERAEIAKKYIESNSI